MIINGDCLTELPKLAAKSCQMCCTSPPYWGLRDYRVSGQIGLEKTPEEYVSKMVAVFSEVWRVLKDDGTLWLNLGDCYAGSWGAQSRGSFTPGTLEGASGKDFSLSARQISEHPKGTHTGSLKNTPGLKPKDLIGIPWRVAFALQSAGWYLRCDIIWSKLNPMPESVTDRPTKSHEYIFLMSKQPKYYYDAEAIKEPVKEASLVRADAGVKFGGNNLCPDTRLQSGKLWSPKPEGANSRMQRSRDASHQDEYDGKHRSEGDQSSGRRILKNVLAARENGGTHDAPFGVNRNKRSVWTVATAPYKGSHFATFPPNLIKPCILAGSRPGDTVLDPFSGSGTTGQVAIELGRKCVLIELNPDYVGLAQHRTNVTPGLPL